MNTENKFPTHFRTCTVIQQKNLEHLRSVMSLWSMHADQLDAHCCKEKKGGKSLITYEIASRVLASYTVTQDICKSLQGFKEKMEKSQERCIIALDERNSIQAVAIISLVAQEIILLATNPSNLNVPNYPQGEQVKGASLAVIFHIFQMFSIDSSINAKVFLSAKDFYNKLGFSTSVGDENKGGPTENMQVSVKKTLQILSVLPLKTTKVSEDEVSFIINKCTF